MLKKIVSCSLRVWGEGGREGRGFGSVTFPGWWGGGEGEWMGRVCKNSFVLLSFGVALFLLAKYGHQKLNTFFYTVKN